MKNIQSMIETFQTKQTERFTNVLMKVKYVIRKLQKLQMITIRRRLNLLKKSKMMQIILLRHRKMN